MKFTVVWLKSAENDLTQIYLDAPDRAAITDAANAVDALLATEKSLEIGVPYLDSLRIVDEPPLRFVYSVDVQDRRVRVGRVEWLW